MKTCLRAIFGLSATLILLLLASSPGRTEGAGPPPQPADVVLQEMQVVYLANLERWANGHIPPMRWNRQLTNAARWFSWDAIEVQYPTNWCDHTDSLGRSAGERAAYFGYPGFAGGENAICGYLAPDPAVQAWMNSTTGHRENMLNPFHRETGLGYYTGGLGFVAQDLGNDSNYPPVIIDYEAITTTSPSVGLYIYNRPGGGSFADPAPANQMMISNNPAFAGAGWETFRNTTNWSLLPGTGWRTVYVRARDSVGRTTTVSDTIYLGASVPVGELGLHLASTTDDHVMLCELNGSGLTHVQLSQDWFVDDTHQNFGLNWGNGGRVNDSAAIGGTAFGLYPGPFPTAMAWVWTTDFYKDTDFIAYFRLRVSDNSSPASVVNIRVKGGGVEYPSSAGRTIYGTDFAAANVYQEFAIPFRFNTNPSDPFLIFYFQLPSSPPTNVYVDGVYIFAPPQPIQNPLFWHVPGGSYRGGGVWLRYSNSSGSVYSTIEDAAIGPSSIGVAPNPVVVMADSSTPSPFTVRLTVAGVHCGGYSWNASESASWLNTAETDDTLELIINTGGLSTGTHDTTVTVTAAGVAGSPVDIPVTLLMVDEVHHNYLPLIPKGF